MPEQGTAAGNTDRASANAKAKETCPVSSREKSMRPRNPDQDRLAQMTLAAASDVAPIVAAPDPAAKTPPANAKAEPGDDGAPKHKAASKPKAAGAGGAAKAKEQSPVLSREATTRACKLDQSYKEESSDDDFETPSGRFK